MVTPAYVARPAKLSETAAAVSTAAETLRQVRDRAGAGRPAAGAFGALPESTLASAACDEARERVGQGLGDAARATDRLAGGVEKCAIGYQKVDQDVAEKFKKLLPADRSTAGDTGTSSAADVPRLSTGEQRRAAIIGELPGRIDVAANPDAHAYPNPIYARPSREEVTANAKLIESAARRHGLDPDLVKAVVWMESTHGWYDEWVPGNKSIRPMNVHAAFWSDLVTRESLSDPATNIEAGVRILAGISDRVVDPTPEKILSLYNNLRTDQITGYGLTAAAYYRDKPWLSR